MSKALVINGANFAANKVEVITLSQVVPCTGLSITPTTVAFDALGATQQITPTVAPVDTTDTVYFASSNVDVVTVSASGLITCVGVGSATVTVTCGSQNAVITVTSTITVNADDIISTPNYYFNANPNRDYLGRTGAATDVTAFFSTTHESGAYQAINTTESGYDGMFGFAIPGGTTNIKINANSDNLYSTKNAIMAFVNSKVHQEYQTGIRSAKRITGILYFPLTLINNEYIASIDLTDTQFDGLTFDAFVLAFRYADTSSAANAPKPIITFS